MRRAQIILHRADGLSQAETARRVGVNRPVVVPWEQRFGAAGLAGLADAKGRGRKPSVALETKAAIVSRATQPPPGRTRWSVRSMAKATGVSKATVQRLWRANDLKPHLVRAFKLSNDPQFEAKFWDVIGLYLQPPDKALVLCCDEKSQCQALERTQPGLPLGIGHVRTRTHDYTRHGTITLFAALSYLDGKIFSQTAPRHTHQQWLGFLKQLEKETPGELTLHLIIDNYATHKHPKVRRWIVWRNARQRRQHGSDRIVLHFTPTVEFVAEPGRALLPRSHRGCRARGQLRQRAPARQRDRGLPRRAQSRPQALRLECQGRGRPRQDPACPRRPPAYHIA